MRILHISSARSFGGGERHVADLTRLLVQRKYEIFAALVPSSSLRSELSHLPAVNLITLPLKNALDLSSARRLARFVRERQIEIVHAHVARDYPLAAYAARRARFVITRHVPFALSKLHQLTLANVSRVIAVSDPVAHELSARGIVPAAKIRVIPNGIDLRRFERMASREPEREKLRRALQSSAALFVGTIGELSEVKGQVDFVRAAALIVAEREFAETAFIIAGADNDPTQRNRARIEELIAQENLQTHVHLLGFVPDVAPLLAALDVYVSAARAEAFGLAMVEALACGVPVVATATDGARSIIEDGVSGRVVPTNDAPALARALTELLRDAETRTQFGEAGRRRARESFSLEKMADATEEVYREALTGK